MKHLFDETDHYTLEAMTIDEQAMRTLRPIFDFWVKEGSSRRDVFHVLQGAALDLMMMSVLETDKKSSDV